MFDQFLRLFFFFHNGPLQDDSLWMVPFAVEFLFWCWIVLLTGLLLLWRPRWIEQVENHFARFSRHRIRCIVLAGLLALGLRAALLPWVPIPAPFAHDEYSYLLQAQTFNAGRLANPTHPMWLHFETYHVNMRPTYHSMYPPGQAIFLAMGLRFFRDPWFGVWLSVGLMCSAVCWMLQGWLPPRWALLGSLFCVLRFGIFGSWINSYWGGAAAAIGGALVLGALPRLQSGKDQSKKSVIAYSLLFAAGLAILANTRPLEGLAFSILPCAVLLFWMARQHRLNSFAPKTALACLAAVLLPVAVAMLYYNWRSTGNPLLMPYVLNMKTYHISKPFLWQTRYDFPVYHHFMMRKLYFYHELPDYLKSRHLYGIIELTEEKLHVYYDFFLWPMLIAVLPACFAIARNKRMRLLLYIALVLLFTLLIQLWPPAGHYAAPGTCIIIALLVMSVRLARTLHWGRFKVGVALSRAIVISVFAMLLLSIAHTFVDPWDFSTDFTHREFERQRVESELSRLPGKHLVIVHPNKNSSPSYDWIYNEPDIDRSKIAWARDMGVTKNQELLDYFSDRHIWFIDHEGRGLVPYDQRPMAAPIELYAAHPSSVSGASQIAQARQKELHAK